MPPPDEVSKTVVTVYNSRFNINSGIAVTSIHFIIIHCCWLVEVNNKCLLLIELEILKFKSIGLKSSKTIFDGVDRKNEVHGLLLHLMQF